MIYDNIKKAIFLSRPNRFIAQIIVDGIQESCHVKNTGRCQELLIPGTNVYVQECDAPKRKTKYDLIAVEKGNRIINMDAQAPNRVFQEWASSGRFLPNLKKLTPETSFGTSRFDFYFEGGNSRGFVEVKGVTLEINNKVLFPDAPTERGVKHLNELILCKQQGYAAYICFVIQMEAVESFSPNDQTHPAFGVVLRHAAAEGVLVLALSCHVGPNLLEIAAPVPVRL